MSRVRLFALVLMLACVPAVRAAGLGPDVDRAAVTTEDLPGYRLESREVLEREWPVVESVPEALRTPESPESHRRPSTFTVDEERVGKRDGLHQVWVGRTQAAPGGLSVDPIVVVDYTSYDTPEQAQNAVYYLISRYRFPLVGFGPRSRVGPSANVSRIPVGDVGFHITYGPNNNVIFYTQGKAVVLIDCSVQAWEDPRVLTRIKKVEAGP